METRDEGPSLRIDRFAAEVETKVPKAKADAHASGKGHMVRVGSTSDRMTYGKKLLECAVEASMVLCANISKRNSY